MSGLRCTNKFLHNVLHLQQDEALPHCNRNMQNRILPIKLRKNNLQKITKKNTLSIAFS
jgi:hypothetical protein